MVARSHYFLNEFSTRLMIILTFMALISAGVLARPFPWAGLFTFKFIVAKPIILSLFVIVTHQFTLVTTLQSETTEFRAAALWDFLEILKGLDMSYRIVSLAFELESVSKVTMIFKVVHNICPELKP